MTTAALCFTGDVNWSNADAWHRAVKTAAGSEAEIFVVTQAPCYKSAEFWAFSKGIPIERIINTGSSNAEEDEVPLNGLAKVWRRLAKTQHASSAAATTGLLVITADWQVPEDASALLTELLSRSGADAWRLISSAGISTAQAPVVLARYLPKAFCEDRLFSSAAGGELELPLTAAIERCSSTAAVAADDVTCSAPVSRAIAPPFLPSLVPASTASSSSVPPAITARGYARVGVLGNPSDGYNGKTLSVTIDNFYAQALLQANSDPDDKTVALAPHPLFDCSAFSNALQLSTISSREGYNGGMRLMQAAVHRFHRHLTSLASKPGGDGEGAAIVSEALKSTRGFSLHYHTTVPRQVGLAGSSAILTALVRCLMQHYGIDSIEKAAAVGLDDDRLPTFVLSIESEELGITAGLQDRVVQAYTGLVSMDFSATTTRIKETGHGNYVRLPLSSLPPLFLAYAADPTDSGRIHAPVKQRWLNGDVEVVEGMQCIASLADEGRRLCEERPYNSFSSGIVEASEDVAHAWAELFTRNFDTRRRLFGDAALGKDNLRMIAIARECGASAKLPGSGGAVVGVVDALGVLGPSSSSSSPSEVSVMREGRVREATSRLRAAYEAEGYVFTPLRLIAEAE